jgi:hypothetical protein
MSGMISHSIGENRRMSFNVGACAARIAAGAVVLILMARFSPALPQAAPPTSQTAGDGNAQDDHSYLPPTMRSQIEAAKSPVTVEAEAQARAPAKTISLRRASRRRARRESWDSGWGGGRGWSFFGN